MLPSGPITSERTLALTPHDMHMCRGSVRRCRPRQQQGFEGDSHWQWSGGGRGDLHCKVKQQAFFTTWKEHKELSGAAWVQRIRGKRRREKKERNYVSWCVSSRCALKQSFKYYITLSLLFIFRSYWSLIMWNINICTQRGCWALRTDW